MSAAVPSEITIRRAEITDAVQIARVHVDSWRAAYAGLMPDDVLASLSVERRAEGWRHLLAARPPHCGLIAIRGSTAVGFAYVGPCRDEGCPADAGELMAIYVRPDAWGNGWGAVLHRAALSGLSAAHFPVAVLWVLEANARAHAFFARQGWSLDGARRGEEYRGTTLQVVRYQMRVPGSQ
ncbi:MAG TPA: GNAT family N-acetyltransferase [Streptosporangiaceae bacterium]|nr:GNAT family N-acetyltransferase [Streptosporangiaceae bacterium]